MGQSRKKSKILGGKYNFDIFKDWLGNKILSWRRQEYERLNNIFNQLERHDFKIIDFSQGMWHVKKGSAKLYFRDATSDFDVVKQVFVLDEYLPLIEAIKKHNYQPESLVDLGGNIGLTSIILNEVFQLSKIVVVEPSLDNYQILKKNLEANKIEFIGHNSGVWNSNTKLSIKTDFRDGEAWSLTVEEDDNGEIEALDLLTLMKEPVDILKIDIEGSEFKLFENSDYAARFLNKVKFIAIEIHDECGSRKQINDILTANGFNYIVAGELTIGTKK